MLKKFLLIALVVLTVLSLTACDDDSNGIVSSDKVNSIDIIYYESIDSSASETVIVTKKSDIKKLCKIMNSVCEDGTKGDFPMDFPRYALTFHLEASQLALYIDAGGVAAVTGLGNVDLRFEQSYFDDIAKIYEKNLTE